MKLGIFSFAVITTILSAISCSTTVTNRSQLNFISDSQLNEMGKNTYKDILSKSKLSTNSRLVAQVREIGRDIAKASGANFDWEFNVIDDPKNVNAFCLPGGKIAVYTGIIPIAQNNAGLAAIMGHEVAHAVLKHGGERMSQSMIIGAGMSIAQILLKDSKYQNIIAGALGVGANYGVLMPFSRQNEAEADRLGLEYMVKAGYDPEESVYLWQRMAKSGGKSVPEILSTHPDPIKRSKGLKRAIPQVIQIYDASSKKPTRKLYL